MTLCSKCEAKLNPICECCGAPLDYAAQVAAGTRRYCCSEDPKNAGQGIQCACWKVNGPQLSNSTIAGLIQMEQAFKS